MVKKGGGVTFVFEGKTKPIEGVWYAVTILGYEADDRLLACPGINNVWSADKPTSDNLSRDNCLLSRDKLSFINRADNLFS